MISRIEALSTQPESGSWLPEDDRAIYREILQGPYRVIYRYVGATVYIVAIHHSARLLTVNDLSSPSA